MKRVEAYRNATPSNIKQTASLKTLDGNVVSLNTEKGTLIFKPKALEHKIMITYNVENIDARTLEHEIIEEKTAFKMEIDLNERQFRETHNAYEFDYQKYLYANNVIGQYHLKSYEVSDGLKKSILAHFNSRRMKLMRLVENLKVAEYFNALILGHNDSLSEKDLFRRLGISHVFAISGMHFGLIYASLYKLIKGPRGCKSILTMGLLICYWGLIGFSYSAGRAVFLVIYVEVSRMLSRKIDALSAVALTNLILLFIFPNAVLAVSYQLSFIAYLLIAYVYQRLNRHKKMHKMIGSFYFVFFIQIAFLPIQLYYFNEVNLLAFLPNLIIVPLISALFPFFFLIPLLGTSIVWLLEKCLHGIEFVAKLMPIWCVEGQILTPSQFKIIFIFAFVYFVYKSIRISQSLILKKSQMTFMALMTSWMIISGFNFSKSEIHFFDVGHGDSALIMNDHHPILIDTGDPYTDLTQMLIKRDIYKIDALILSHAHSDHVGGLKQLAETYPIYQIYCNQETYEVIKADISASTEVIVVKSPIEITLANARLTLIPSESDDTNDNAIAVWYDSKEIKGIFLGDISGPVYEKFPSVLTELDFVKIAHHGSKTGLSKSFLKEHPIKYAIISHNEKYLMPNKSILDQLEEEGIEIYKTYNCGEIILNKRGIFSYLTHKSTVNP
ncbi:ComE-like protein [Fusibacter sp. 3D3]|nr:ComE-like protein [Fusibacter sp. 3D3]